MRLSPTLALTQAMYAVDNEESKKISTVLVGNHIKLRDNIAGTRAPQTAGSQITRTADARIQASRTQ